MDIREGDVDCKSDEMSGNYEFITIVNNGIFSFFVEVIYWQQLNKPMYFELLEIREGILTVKATKCPATNCPSDEVSGDDVSDYQDNVTFYPI